MDAEKWQKIASSFSYDTIQKATQDVRKETQVSKLNQISFPTNPVVSNPTVDFENPDEALLSTSTFRNHNASTTPRCIDKAMADMNSTILKLTKIVQEKSQVIQKQETIIEILQRKLDTYVVGESANQISQPVNKNPKVIQLKSSDCNELKASASDLKLPAGVAPLILNRLEDLEKRMDQFTKSLPKKVQLCCEKYISSCKFRYDESGELLVVSSSSNSTTMGNKAIWERSPRIKPKVNFSSQIRQKTSVIHDKENTSAITSVNSNVYCNEGVENYLKHLETIVTDLKVGFVQLLLKKVAGTRGNNGSSVRTKNGKDYKLNCNALRNL